MRKGRGRVGREGTETRKRKGGPEEKKRSEGGKVVGAVLGVR